MDTISKRIRFMGWTYQGAAIGSSLNRGCFIRVWPNQVLVLSGGSFILLGEALSGGGLKGMVLSMGGLILGGLILGLHYQGMTLLVRGWPYYGATLTETACQGADLSEMALSVGGLVREWPYLDVASSGGGLIGEQLC